MSVHQTPDGRWFAAYRRPGDRTVRRKYFGRGAEGKIAAKRWEAEFLDQSSRPSALAETRPALTWAELAQRYLDAKPLAANTRSALVYALNRHVLPRLGRLAVAELTMAHLAKVDADLVALGRAIGTRNRIRAYCRAIGQWGEDNDLVPANPFRKFHPEVKREGKAPALLADDELEAVYQAASPHLRWAVEVLANTGVRPGPTELFGLKMSDVDFKAGGLWVTRSKTNAPRTLLPLRPEFLDRLRGLAEAEPGRVWVVEYKGRQVKKLQTAWRAALRRAGIARRLRLYDLRHWFATKLLSGGADIKAASELLGHSSPNLTLSTYYHLLEGQKRTAMDALKIPNLAGFDKPADKPTSPKQAGNEPV